MASTGFQSVQQANSATQQRLSNQPRANRPSVQPFVNAYNSSAPNSAEQVPGTARRAQGAQQLIPGMIPERDTPLLPVSQSHSEPFPVEDVLVNKSGIDRTPLTRQKNWQAVSVGRAGLAPTAPSSVFSTQERMRAMLERADISSSTDIQQDGNGDVLANETDVNRTANVLISGTKQASSDMKKAGVYTWTTIIGGFIAVAGMIVAFFRPSIRMRGLAVSFIGIVMSVVGGYMWGNNVSSKSATENINAVPLSTGWKEPSLTNGRGWDAWPSITGMYGSATLPGTKPIMTKKPVATKRPKRQNLVAESGSLYDMNLPILVAGIDAGVDATDGKTAADYGIIPQRRDQADADPFRPPPDPMNTFEDRLRFQGTDPNSLEGPRAGVGYQRSPLPEGRKTLPVAALMRAPEDSNMDAPTFAEYMRQLGGELPNQFYQAHPYYTFNAEWDRRGQIDDDQTQFGISSSPDQMNRKNKYKDPRLQQAAAKTMHLKDPPPGSVPPLEKTHPWLERDENGMAPPAALMITPIAAEREVAQTIEIEELPMDEDEGRDPFGRERMHVPRSAGPPAPVDTMNERKRRLANPIVSSSPPVMQAENPVQSTEMHATGVADDDDAGGGFLSAFTEKTTPSDEAINNALQLAGRRD